MGSTGARAFRRCGRRSRTPSGALLPIRTAQPGKIRARDGATAPNQVRAQSRLPSTFPVLNPRDRAFFEATFDPGPLSATGTFRRFRSPRAHRRADSRDRAIAECSWPARGCWPRRAPGVTAPRRSSEPRPRWQALRSTIERVSATDFTGAPRRRKRRRKGTGGTTDSRAEPPAQRTVLSPSIAPPWSRRCSRPSSLASRTASPPVSARRRGKFEAADGGTLFLDEVSDLVAVGAGQAAESNPGSGGRTRRRHRRTPRRHPDRRGDEPALRWISSSRGSFRPDLFYRLSGVDVRCAVACASAGPTSPELAQLLLWRVIGSRRQVGFSPGSAGRARHLRLAWQRARARAAHRARSSP